MWNIGHAAKAGRGCDVVTPGYTTLLSGCKWTFLGYTSKLCGGFNDNAMTKKTPSETLFEEFCRANRLRYTDVPEGTSHTVDYLLHLGDVPVAVEIEALEQMRGWNLGGVHTRHVGEHLRRKMVDARKQVQAASKAGHPTLLLVHNAVDPFQAFGTDRYRDKNAMLQGGRNTSFSGVGQLSTSPNGPRRAMERVQRNSRRYGCAGREPLVFRESKSSSPHNKQLQRTVTRRRGRGACAPRFIGQRAAAELRR